MSRSAFALLVDEERRVVASDCVALPEGTTLSPASWLGAVLGDLVAAAAEGSDATRVGREYESGAHWLLRARALDGAPRRVRVEGIDATEAVVADRRAVLASVMHSVRNVSFALSSVVEALAHDRPTGPELDEYLAHLRDPAERLAATMMRVAALVDARTPTFRVLRVEEILEEALSRVAQDRRPRRVSVSDRAMALRGDCDLLAEVVAAMVEGAPDAETSLDVVRVEEGGRASAGFMVDERAPSHEGFAPGALWDLGDGHRLESRIRLAAARAVVAAHGGRVTAERSAPGRLRVGALVPLVSGS